MIDCERNVIGSILLEPKSIALMDVTPDMFTDPMLAGIFENCKKWENDGEEINALRVARSITSDVVSTEEANKFIAELVTSHDGSASDDYCCGEIRKSYRARKASEIIGHVEFRPDNIDNVLAEVSDSFDKLKESKSKGATRLSDLVKYRGEYFIDKGKKLYDTGIAELDESIGSFDGGDLIIIAARPSVGKSAFSLQMARRYARRGLKTAYFDLEMTEKQMYERAIAGTSGIGMKRIRNAISFYGDEKEQFRRGNELLAQEKNFYLYDDVDKVSEIRAEQLKEAYDVIFVDYLQLLTPDVPRGSRRQEVADISRGLKRICMECNIPIIALSQLNRASEYKADKEPTMAELREAGDLEQDASTILIMWNPNPDNKAEKMIKVEKGRQTGNARQRLRFDGAKMIFTSDNDLETDFKDADNMDEIPF